MMKFMVLLFYIMLCLDGYGYTQNAPPAYGKLAARMLSLMNQSVDPCQDFYQYACGNYPNIYNGKDDDDDMEMMAVKIINQLGQALYQYDPNYATKPIQYPFDQAGIAFDRCMSGTPEYPNQDVKSLMNYINQFGGWPTVQTFEKNVPTGGAAGLAGEFLGTWELPTFFQAHISNKPTEPIVNSLLILGSYMDIAYNSSANVITPIYPSIHNLELAYGMLATAVANLSGVQLDRNQLYKDAKMVSNLIIENMEVTFKYARLNPVPPFTLAGQYNYLSGFYNAFTVSQALQRWPHIDWVNMLLNMAPGNTNVNNFFKYPLYIGMPEYFDWVDGIFANYDDRTLRNMEMFVFVSAQASNLPSLRDTYIEIMSDRWGERDRPTTEGFCAYKLSEYLPYLIGRIYAGMSGLTETDLANLSEMIGIVMSSWRGMITEVNWMSDYSKHNAYAKIENLIRNVGWPDWIMNDASLAAYYTHLNITIDDDAFTSINKIARWNTWKYFSTIGQPYDRYVWPFSPATVNAAYMDPFNSISFPAAIMTGPIYNSSFPTAYNYGRIGWVMGHELGHAFDNNGVYFGSYGQFYNNTWQDASSQQGFINMSKCVVNEYNQFCEVLEGETFCVDGEQTLGENIADNGGLVASHRAWQAINQLSGGDYKMPPGYGPISTATDEQFFFISAAQSWCSNIPEDEQIYLLMVDVHSPDKFRVFGTFQNMPAFGKAFQCKLGDPYYPKTHCHVWVS